MSGAKGTFGGNTPYFQKSRVRSLHELGAEVWLCRGDDRDGLYHRKGLIAGRRYFYTGNGNFTHWSRQHNSEWLFRMVGPVVADALADLAADRVTGREWDGSD